MESWNNSTRVQKDFNNSSRLFFTSTAFLFVGPFKNIIPFGISESFLQQPGKVNLSEDGTAAPLADAWGEFPKVPPDFFLENGGEGLEFTDVFFSGKLTQDQIYS